MGSKKHKDKDRERKKHRRSRSRSRSREKEHRKEKHAGRHKSHREKRNKKLEEIEVHRHQDDSSIHVFENTDEVQILFDETKQEKDDEVQLDTGEPYKGSGESLSISDTNRLRAKLGLKPLANEEPTIPGLEDPSDTLPPANIEQKEIFVKTENIAQTLEIQKIREKVAVMREKRKLNKKIANIKSLGESDSDEDNVLSWVHKSRQQEKEKAKALQTAKLLDEMDQEFGVGALVEEEFDPVKTYTSQDLRGLQIGHNQSAFKEGQTVIMTLKDQGVLDADEDRLENVNMIDDEKAEKNVYNKKHKADYLPYDEPEYDEFGIVKKSNMLAKYDETIEGVKKDSFKIGAAKMNREQEKELISLKLKQQRNVSLELPSMTLAREYYTHEEMVAFKKPKKKRKIRKREMLSAGDLLKLGAVSEVGSDHGSRKRNSENNSEAGIQVQNDIKQEPTDEDIEIDISQAENTEILGPEEDLTGVSIEDDKAELDFELALNRARKLKQLEGKLGHVEKIAQTVSVKNEPEENQESGNIVMNSIAEFCRTLGEIPTYGMSGNREDDEDMMDFEQDLGDENRTDEIGRGAWNEVDIDNTPVEIKSRENQPILEEEPDVSTGLAGALKLAMKKGYLDQKTNKIVNLTKHSNLEAQSYTIEEKFYEDDKFGRRDRYTGPIQDFRDKDNYRPEVKLEYIDDGGRLLNAKEAFRYLSHKFHGKGPGKNKVDKRTKKLDQEGKLKQMSSTDTPLNTLKLLQEKQRDLQTPFILLSGGSKAFTGNSIIKSTK